MPTVWLLVFLLMSWPSLAQPDSVQHTNANIIRRTHPQYDEEIMYFGKHDQYFTVRTLRKNGSLFRSDSYEVLPGVLPGGFRLDSLRRIIPHGATKIMHPNGRVYVSCDYKEGLLQGPFMVFYDDGAIKRRELYRQGRLARSECYDPDGGKIACEPFQQPAQFLGKVSELERYISNQVGSVVDGERVRRVTALLAINEIGQVVQVETSADASELAGSQRTTAIARMRQAIQNMPEWTPNRLNWKPAITDGKATPSVCVIRIYRYQGRLDMTMNFRL